jgi:hypothetical protein
VITKNKNPKLAKKAIKYVAPSAKIDLSQIKVTNLKESIQNN